jgi:hypothetical protein
VAGVVDALGKRIPGIRVHKDEGVDGEALIKPRGCDVPAAAGNVTDTV